MQVRFLVGGLLTVLLATLLSLPRSTQAQNAQGQTYVFLVACSAYDNNTHFSTLPFTISEMEEFRDVLIESGVERKNVRILSNRFKRDSDDSNEKRYSPTRKNIVNELSILLKKMEEEDTLIAAFSMHGMQPTGAKTAYICPIDAQVDDPKTMIPTEGEEGLYQMLKASGVKRKLLIVNACRDDPNNKPTMAANKANFDKNYKYELPVGMAGIFSCQPGQFSYFYKDEGATKDRKRSLFFHHLIESWKGNYGEGKLVTLEDVFREVKQRTSDDADQIFGDSQVPVVRREYAKDWIVRGKGVGKVEPMPKKDDIGKVEGPPKPLVAPFTEEQAKKARAEWAKYLKVPERKSIELGKDKVKLDLVLIPPGKFKMGSPKGEGGDDETQHDVEIAKAFYMAVTETTQAQYEAVLGENPSDFQKGKDGANKVVGKDTSKFPVASVSWNDAVQFCEKSEVKGIGLPTEAQWEYACRAGTETKYHFGNDIAEKNANFNANLGRTEKVGSYPANGFGLFDMHGNVWEWCLDGYRKDYEKLEKKDPIEKQSNDYRVLRGGSWDDDAYSCRAAFRYFYTPDVRSGDIGFRLVVLP